VALWVLAGVVAGVLVVVAGRIAVAAAGVGTVLVATDADEAGALLETFGVIGWALVVEATGVEDAPCALVAETAEVEDAPCALETVAGGAISTVTLGPLVPAPVPALLAGVSP
jgi:hypothetical protein